MEFITFIFGLGYLLQHLGMFLQIMKMEKLRSSESVSVDTLILFVFSTISRIIWTSDTILKDTYFTHFELTIGMIVIFYTIYLVLIKYNFENSILDLLNNNLIPIFLRWYIILIVSIILSYFFFPGNEGQKFDLQMLVSFTIFTEALNLFPQIFFLRKKKDSHDISDIYNFLMLISRFFRLIFWFKLYFEENSIEFLIFADLVNLFVVGGYVYNSFIMKDGFKLPTEIEKNKIY
jgi:hypothetical protein